MATLSISITVSDAKVADIKNAVCKKFGYDPATDGTQNAFVKKTIINFLLDTYTEVLRDEDAIASRQRINQAIIDAALT